MQQIKFFVGNDISSLEKKINSWLLENGGITILKMTQTESEAGTESWSMAITILYREA